jgi:hypothetical protein
MATNDGYIEIANAAAYKFSNALDGDIVFYGSNATNNLLIGSMSNINANILMGSSNINFNILGTVSTAYIKFSANNGATNLCTMLATGNVGIGSTTPGYKLDVNGIINATALYVGGSPYIGSQWTTTSSNIYYSTGNVGIKNATPTYNLDVTGIIAASTDIVVSSDRRLKDNLEVISDSLEKVKSLTGYTFDLNNASDGKRRSGLIAQEVELVLPEVIHDDPRTDLKSIAYGNMAGILVEAIKSLDKKLDNLYAVLGIDVPV